ncbi:hypothetical protein FKP32DRAFT_1671481 [Trametes sanguinea]|nr:hypothetical protein FKP32DRAFT_1671481 [Trametes sanguinea]
MDSPTHTSPPDFPLTQRPPRTPQKPSTKEREDLVEKESWTKNALEGELETWREKFKVSPTNVCRASGPKRTQSLEKKMADDLQKGASTPKEIESPVSSVTVTPGDSPLGGGTEGAEVSFEDIFGPSSGEGLEGFKLDSSPMRLDEEPEPSAGADAARAKKRQRHASPETHDEPPLSLPPTYQAAVAAQERDPAVTMESIRQPNPTQTGSAQRQKASGLIQALDARPLPNETQYDTIMRLVNEVASQVKKATLEIVAGPNAQDTPLSPDRAQFASGFLNAVINQLRRESDNLEAIEKRMRAPKTEDPRRKAKKHDTRDQPPARREEQPAPPTATPVAYHQSATAGPPQPAMGWNDYNQPLRQPSERNAYPQQQGLQASIHANKNYWHGDGNQGRVMAPPPAANAALHSRPMQWGSDGGQGRLGQAPPGMNSLAKLALSLPASRSSLWDRESEQPPMHRTPPGVTPRPLSGFPDASAGDSRDRIRNVNDADYEYWQSQEKKSKLALMVHGEFRLTEAWIRESSDRIYRLLKRTMGADNYYMTGPSVPDANEFPDVVAENTSPLWLLSGVEIDIVKRILALGTISSKPITVTAYPDPRVPPRFICTLLGFNELNDEAAARALRDILKDEVNVASIRDLLAQDPEDRPRDPGARAAQIVATLTAKCFRTGPEWNAPIATNLYMDSPTTVGDWWDDWRARMIIKYLNDSYNIHFTYLGRCADCRGVDHRTANCPFLLVPGWNGRRRDAGGKTTTWNGQPGNGGMPGGTQAAPRGQPGPMYSSNSYKVKGKGRAEHWQGN